MRQRACAARRVRHVPRVLIALALLLAAAAPAEAAELPRPGSLFGQQSAASPLGHIVSLGDDSVVERAWLAAPGRPLGPPVPVPGGYFSAVALGPAGEGLLVFSEGGPEGRLMASFRPPDGAFGPAVPISEGPTSGPEARVGFDAAGNAIVIWTQVGPGPDLVARARGANGSWSALEPIPGADGAFRVQLAVAPSGAATAVWREDDGSGPNRTRLVAANRPPGGRFGPQQTLAPARYDADDAALDMNARGDAVVAWVESNDATTAEELRFTVAGVFRRGDGRFGRRIALARRGTDGSVPSVSVAPSGRMVIAYRDNRRGLALARIRTAAGRLLPVRTLSADAGENTGVAALAAGPGVVAWFDRDPGRTILRLAVAGADGRFRHRRTLARGSRYPEVPQLFATPTGLAYLLPTRTPRLGRTSLP